MLQELVWRGTRDRPAARVGARRLTCSLRRSGFRAGRGSAGESHGHLRVACPVPAALGPVVHARLFTLQALADLSCGSGGRGGMWRGCVAVGWHGR